MIGSTTNNLNAASVPAHKGRSSYGGAAFAAINTLVRPAAGEGEGLNAAVVPPDALLSDLNHLRAAPQLAAALAGVNRARQEDAEQAKGEAHDEARREELTRHAQRLVSQTFFGAMLKQMRNSPFKSELFSGGRGGEMFAGMFDQHLADRMARGAGNDLVRSIVRRLEKLDAKHAAAVSQEELEKNPRPEKPNPFANVRVHVAPNLRG